MYSRARTTQLNTYATLKSLMVKKNQKKLTSKYVFILLSVYVLFGSLFLVATNMTFIWPFILYLGVASYSLYGLYVIATNTLRRPISIGILVETLLLTIVIFSKQIGVIFDYAGIKCSGLFGAETLCSESLNFSVLKFGGLLVVPMVIIAVTTIVIARQWDKS